MSQKLTAKEMSAFIKGNPSARTIQRRHVDWKLASAIHRKNKRVVFYDFARAKKILGSQGLLA